MAIEVYSLVVFSLPHPDKKLIPKEEWEYHKVNLDDIIEYHFCLCQLVQPPYKPGAKHYPIPRWEVVQDRIRFASDVVQDTTLRFSPILEVGTEYYNAYGDAFECVETFDKYNDGPVSAIMQPVRYLKNNGVVRKGEEVRLPNYEHQWNELLGPKANDIKPGVPFLPVNHPIEDRKVQLRQIRFLFPETRTMPMPIALDYVRDRL